MQFDFPKLVQTAGWAVTDCWMVKFFPGDAAKSLRNKEGVKLICDDLEVHLCTDSSFGIFMSPLLTILSSFLSHYYVGK